MNLIFLPATEPGDQRYGSTPERLEGYPEIVVHQVRFPHMVWYNATVLEQALQQIKAIPLSPLVLVGFSKSGLGAWNIARAIPDRLAATIIFDAPMMREELPPWGTAPFYANNEEWLADLPLRLVAQYKAVMPKNHQLILISGDSFREEMIAMSQTLDGIGVKHVFLDRPQLKHHWNSGWIAEALANLRQQEKMPM